MGIIAKILGRWTPGAYARLVDGEWQLTPGEFYPAMIAHIRQAAEAAELPKELIDKSPRPGVDPQMAARRYQRWARRIQPEAWEDALQPLAEVAASGKVLGLFARAEALECARLWFTRALKNHAEPPIRIRILKDERFRLGVDAEFRG